MSSALFTSHPGSLELKPFPLHLQSTEYLSPVTKTIQNENGLNY